MLPANHPLFELNTQLRSIVETKDLARLAALLGGRGLPAMGSGEEPAEAIHHALSLQAPDLVAAAEFAELLAQLCKKNYGSHAEKAKLHNDVTRRGEYFFNLFLLASLLPRNQALFTALKSFLALCNTPEETLRLDNYITRQLRQALVSQQTDTSLEVTWLRLILANPSSLDILSREALSTALDAWDGLLLLPVASNQRDLTKDHTVELSELEQAILSRLNDDNATAHRIRQHLLSRLEEKSGQQRPIFLHQLLRQLIAQAPVAPPGSLIQRPRTPALPSNSPGQSVNAITARHSVRWNGIDATTGGPLFPDWQPEEALKLLDNVPMEHRARGPVYGVDLRDLASAGWGVILPARDETELREALQPLLRLRRSQAGARYREYSVRPNASRLGDRDAMPASADALVADTSSTFGAVDPTEAPYYLLIVGSPSDLSYEFQIQLSHYFAVGRIYFPDLDDYHRYALAVVAADLGEIARPKRVVLFGPNHPDDEATKMSSEQLLAPLAARLSRWTEKSGPFEGFETQSELDERATKARLGRLLGGPETPALLLTAGHGVGFPPDHPAQADLQGALLCQDWPGYSHDGLNHPVLPSDYFAATDVGSDTRPDGLISFHFACYSLGTMPETNYSYRQHLNAIGRWSNPLVARLPQRLLARGALAAAGQIERAWGYSFLGPGNQQATEAFEAFIAGLLTGLPVGAAMDYFNQRAAALSVRIAELLDQRGRGMVSDSAKLLSLFAAYQDARSYALLGDPAVKLALGPLGENRAQ